MIIPFVMAWALVSVYTISIDKPKLAPITKTISSERHFYYTKKYYKVHKILELE